MAIAIALIYYLMVSSACHYTIRRLLGDWYVDNSGLAHGLALSWGAWAGVRWGRDPSISSLAWMSASAAPLLAFYMVHSPIMTIVLEYPRSFSMANMPDLEFVLRCHVAILLSFGLPFSASAFAGFPAVRRIVLDMFTNYSTDSEKQFAVSTSAGAIRRHSTIVATTMSSIALYVSTLLVLVRGFPSLPVPYPTCTWPIAASGIALTMAIIFNERHNEKKNRKAWVRAMMIMWIAIVIVHCRSCLGCRTNTAGDFEARHASRQGLHDGIDVIIVHQCELRRGGSLRVVEGTYGRSGLKYRLLRLDHAIMGGQWIAPSDVAGHSIYSTFELQAAAWRFQKSSERPRSLHIGVGIGSAVAGLRRRGFVTDVVELHEEVIEAATAFFGLNKSNSHVIAEDALYAVTSLPFKSYDVVIVDVFDGGSSEEGILLDGKFVHDLKRVLTIPCPDDPGLSSYMKDCCKYCQTHGVLAVNLVALMEVEVQDLACRLRSAFDTVRCFDDERDEAARAYVEKDSWYNHSNIHNAIHNVVCFAADGSYLSEVKLDDATETTMGAVEASFHAAMSKREIPIDVNDRECESYDVVLSNSKKQLAFEKSFTHWKTMRTQFRGGFWER